MEKITKCKIDLFIFFARQLNIPYQQIFVRTDMLGAPDCMWNIWLIEFWPWEHVAFLPVIFGERVQGSHYSIGSKKVPLFKEHMLNVYTGIWLARGLFAGELRESYETLTFALQRGSYESLLLLRQHINNENCIFKRNDVCG